MHPVADDARYAVYWAPDAGDPLAAFGAAWLGHDPVAQAGQVLPRDRLGLAEAVADRLTAEPRRYGLHATLKAPFRLKPGATFAQLSEQTAALAATVSAFATPPLRLTNLNGFLALCPSGACGALDDLARRCVVELDALRAPLTAAERARRKPQFLSPDQLQLLDIWGYPHVLAHFRFHITLTKRLDEAERALVEPPLDGATRRFCEALFPVDSIALFGDPGGNAPFQLVQRFALSAT